MPKFCTFTRHRNATPLLINRDLVRAVSYDLSAGGTVLLFDATHSITVSETLEKVVREMNEG
jgi:c-di-GMP-binding flagellar brake protein YcgR